MVNRVTLLGRVGQAPDVKRLENGTPVANYSLATSEQWKDEQGQKKESTEWHRVVAWKQLAELSEKYVAKGSLLFVEGKLTYRKYTDNNGIEKTITEIVATTIRLLEKKESGSTENGTQTASTPSVQTPKEDSPFFQAMPTSIEPLPQAGDEYKNNDNESIKINVMSVESGMVNYIVGEKHFSHTYDEWRTKILPKITKIDDMPF
jgi:single-strand DNA-binding protein